MTKGLMPKRKEILKAVEHSNASRSGPAFLWLDEQLVVLEHSKDIQALLSLSGTLKGRMVTELFAELIGLEDNMRRIALQKTGRFSLEYINRAPANEKPDYLSIRAMPLSLGFKGLILFIEDANENGRLMQELAQRRNELILKQEQLHKANIELAQANRLKGLMISVASHEIGNRLTHIIGLGADLLEQIPASKPYRGPLERMYLAANHLVMSMNQLSNETRSRGLGQDSLRNSGFRFLKLNGRRARMSK